MAQFSLPSMSVNVGATAICQVIRNRHRSTFNVCLILSCLNGMPPMSLYESLTQYLHCRPSRSETHNSKCHPLVCPPSSPCHHPHMARISHSVLQHQEKKHSQYRGHTKGRFSMTFRYCRRRRTWCRYLFAAVLKEISPHIGTAHRRHARLPRRQVSAYIWKTRHRRRFRTAPSFVLRFSYL